MCYGEDFGKDMESLIIEKFKEANNRTFNETDVLFDESHYEG
jgi:hypothetical protein